MNIVIRADSSIEMGNGHIMRCLTLAERLICEGANVIFVCRDFEKNSISQIENKGIKVIKIPSERETFDHIKWTKDNWRLDVEETISVINEMEKSTNILIVDHYGIDSNWEIQMSQYVNKVVVIDDLANRKHYCDLIIDPTFGESSEKYNNLIPKYAKGLYGVKYAILREDFRKFQKKDIVFRGRKIKVHMFFGGIDSLNHTTKYSSIILKKFKNVELHVVVGKAFGFTTDLIQLKTLYPENFDWVQDIDNMAEHMSKCDLAIGSPGNATWERACIGLPSAYLATNLNQIPILKRLEKKNLCVFMGEASKLDSATFVGKLSMFLSSETLLKQLFYCSTKHVDGLGTDRVIKELFGLMGEENE